MNSITKGRMYRPTYWLLLGIVVIVYGLLLDFAKKPPAIAELLVVLLGVPRLHDIGRSGWWMVILFGFEIVAIAVSLLILGTIEGALVASGLVLLAMFVAMMILGCIPGQPFSNIYGKVPSPGLSFTRVRI